jgi:1-phosphatidylinositol-4-phosphate 5-kinase
MANFQEGTGKSASFFFFTESKQFVIKTLKDEELDLLARKGLLEKYHNYIKGNPQSMLARFYGIYTIKIKFMKPINVIIMDNVMGKHSEDIVRVFDLKGSTFQRISQGPLKCTSTRKDLNFKEETEFKVQTNEPR